MIQKIVVANALRRSCVSKAFWTKCRKSSLPYAVSVYVAPLFEDVYQSTISQIKPKKPTDPAAMRIN